MKKVNTVLCSLCVICFVNFKGLAQDVLPKIDDREGKVLRVFGFDLRKEKVAWGNSSNIDSGETKKSDSGVVIFGYEKDENGVGYHVLSESATSMHTLSLLPNRSYVLSILIKPDFERTTGRNTREVNIGLRTYDGGGKNIIDNLNGIPINRSDKWERWEWEFTTDQRATSGRVHINMYGFTGGDHIKFADVALIELPVKPLVPFKKGEGVTFRGGPGKLPMKIEDVQSASNSIEVRTTGSLFSFDLENNTITTRQLLEKERDVAVWKLSTPLKNLEILSFNTIECVLANENITFGIQCDGLMMVSPQKDAVIHCTSKMGGEWNRFASGHLFALDKWGGFTANPHIPLGSGRLSRVDADVRTGRVSRGDLDFSGLYDNKTFLSSAKPGWEIKWYISPGERLGITVFPPRPFPWKESFESNFLLSEHDITRDTYKKWSKNVNQVVMWDFFERGWGQSYSETLELYDEANFKDHIKNIKDFGMVPCPYFSPYFYPSRDPKDFADELSRIKDTYGVNGVYFDGIPSQEWIVAYEEMRMSREVLNDGIIIYHNTGHASNGTAPLGEVSLKIPAIETYADITFGGELVWGDGPEWKYPEYIQSQYRMANNVGTFKSGEWEGVTPLQRELYMLKYNGRASLLSQDNGSYASEERVNYIENIYFPIVKKLQKLWKEKGDDPDFYEKYYLPKFKELTKGMF